MLSERSFSDAAAKAIMTGTLASGSIPLQRAESSDSNLAEIRTIEIVFALGGVGVRSGLVALLFQGGVEEIGGTHAFQIALDVFK